MSLRLGGHSEFIDPPEPPDSAMLERLRANFRAIPRISEVWVVGQRRTYAGLPPSDVTVIVLVLDPALSGKGERDGVLQELCAATEFDPELRPGLGVGFYRKRDVVNEKTRRRALGPAAERIYQREPTDSDGESGEPRRWIDRLFRL